MEWLVQVLTVFIIMISPALHGLEQTEVGIRPCSPLDEGTGTDGVARGSGTRLSLESGECVVRGGQVGECPLRCSKAVHTTSAAFMLSSLCHLPTIL